MPTETNKFAALRKTVNFDISSLTAKIKIADFSDLTGYFRLIFSGSNGVVEFTIMNGEIAAIFSSNNSLNNFENLYYFDDTNKIFYIDNSIGEFSSLDVDIYSTDLELDLTPDSSVTADFSDVLVGLEVPNGISTPGNVIADSYEITNMKTETLKTNKLIFGNWNFTAEGGAAKIKYQAETNG